jgi:D-glucosaminate-6-phosphate ammonia-lyase
MYSLRAFWNQQVSRISRRELFKGGGWIAAAGLLPRASALAAPSPAPVPSLKIGPDIYQSIGVKPLINGRGTITVISGSLPLPEVVRAMEEASKHYVQIDELMEGVGRRLAELTGAEWGIVTSGCSAALTHATSACIAGGNPDKLVRLPDLTGMKDEVIMPKYSRNVYDQAVRSLGVRVIEVETREELEAALGPRTAMIMVLAGEASESGPLSLEGIASAANPKGVPILVDAAAEELTKPNVHLARGATLVAYSGGKCLRGPQCAGLLLGRQDLVRAAWVNSSPHHSFGRAMKVGKEEVMGMLAAVEMWFQRDHEAEKKKWESWLVHIADRIQRVAGVSAEIQQPRGLSNRTPSLRIRWDGAKLGITGEEVEELLKRGEPRIFVGGAGNRRADMASSVSVNPYMMNAGEERIIADRLYAVLSKPPRVEAGPLGAAPAANVSGEWDVRIDFVSGSADHRCVIRQDGSTLAGTHRGDYISRQLNGQLHGNEIWFRSSYTLEGHRLNFEFKGKVEGGRMQGDVDVGEYGRATWTARRHEYSPPPPFFRAIK